MKNIQKQYQRKCQTSFGFENELLISKWSDLVLTIYSKRSSISADCGHTPPVPRNKPKSQLLSDQLVEGYSCWDGHKSPLIGESVDSNYLFCAVLCLNTVLQWHWMIVHSQPRLYLWYLWFLTTTLNNIMMNSITIDRKLENTPFITTSRYLFLRWWYYWGY